MFIRFDAYGYPNKTLMLGDVDYFSVEDWNKDTADGTNAYDGAIYMCFNSPLIPTHKRVVTVHLKHTTENRGKRISERIIIAYPPFFIMNDDGKVIKIYEYDD